jgi:hypothetical protein
MFTSLLSPCALLLQHDMMRAYTIVGGAGTDNLPVANPTSTLPVNIVSGVIYNNWG